MSSFEEMLSYEDVDEAVIFIEGEAKEIWDGVRFWSLVEREYDIESLLGDYV